MPIFDTLVWKMCMYICATHEVNATDHVTMGTVHIFDIYHLTNMVATLHIYVQVHCYCGVPIDPTLVHIKLKHLVCDMNSYKVVDINMKKNKYGFQMQTNYCNDK